MFNEYFGFHENPFSEKHDINFFFLNEKNKKLYQDLIADIYQGIGLSVLIGDKGVGKTAFLQQLIGLDPFQLKVMYVNAKPGLDLTDVLYRKIIPVANSPDTDKKVQLIEHLTNLRRQGINPVLIVDDAQVLDDSSLTSILKLSGQAFEQQPFLQLLFATDPTFLARFDAFALASFKLLISHQYQLDTLTLAEIRDFINFRLEQAGCTRKNLFSHCAIQTIAGRTKGITKLIIQLCNEALQQASLDGTQIINEKTVVLASEKLYLKNGNSNGSIRNIPIKKNSRNGISGALVRHQNCQENLKDNPNQQSAHRRSVSFTFAAIVLLSIGTVFLLNTKPEQTKENPSEANLNAFSQPHAKVYPPPSLIEQPKKYPAIQADSLNDQSGTVSQQIASIKTSLESLETKKSASTSLSTDDRNKLAELDSLTSEPINQISSFPLIEQSSLEQPNPQFQNTTERSKKTIYKKSTRSNSYANNTEKKIVVNSKPTELNPREQQAKHRAEARLKLHQSGINFGIDSLMAAAASGDQKTMELLLTGGIPADIQEQSRGFTALEIAAGYGHNRLIKRLIVKSGASVNLKNFKGRTALMVAAEGGHTDTVDLLLSNGAKVNLKDKNGWTALMFAAYNNHLQTAYVLMDWGANPQLKNNAGRTAMQIARSKGNTELIKMVTQKITEKTSTSNQFTISRRGSLKSTRPSYQDT
jgi:MSHA biogenesis protein MshM